MYVKIARCIGDKRKFALSNRKFLFDQLNFHLAAGQTTCLLGMSGIGKSRFLQLIAGLTLCQPLLSPPAIRKAWLGA